MKTISSLLVGCAIAVLGIFLSGCSGTPSESAGKTILENRVKEDSKGAVRVVSFKKTNGQLNGNLYHLEYEAEIEFVKAGSWTKGGSMETHLHYLFSDQRSGSGATAQMIAAVTGAVDVSQGQHQTVKDFCDFEKTEKGWRGEDGQVY